MSRLDLVLIAAAAVVVILVAVIGSCEGKSYKVGDSKGWTTIGNVDYKQWSATKTFHLGDVILFQYNPQFHNVMQVTHAAYRSCNASSPIATHTSGNDTITLSTNGHHFFLCGVPGHCQSGQKVDINVIHHRRVDSASSSPASSPGSPDRDSPSPSVSSSPASPNSDADGNSPAPSPSSATRRGGGGGGLRRVVGMVLAFFISAAAATC